MEREQSFNSFHHRISALDVHEVKEKRKLQSLDQNREGSNDYYRRQRKEE